VHDEITSALDEDRHRDRLELAVVLEGFELVELENPTNSTFGSTFRELRALKRRTNFGHAYEPTFNGLAIDAEHFCGLTSRDFCNERVEQQMMKIGFSVAVVAFESLLAESTFAREAAESRNALAIAGAQVGAAFLIAERIQTLF